MDQETIAVSQSSVDRYPFAIASPSPPPPQDRDPRSKLVGISTTTTTTASVTAGGGGKSRKDVVTSPARKHSERTTSFAVGFRRPSLPEGAIECLLFVDNEEEILIQLENDVINVKILLASPHLGSLRARVESVMKTLVQLKELVALLSHCQDQVTR